MQDSCPPKFCAATLLRSPSPRRWRPLTRRPQPLPRWHQRATFSLAIWWRACRRCPRSLTRLSRGCMPETSPRHPPRERERALPGQGGRDGRTFRSADLNAGEAEGARLSREGLEFAPHLLAIQESPPAPLPRVVLWVAATLCVVLVLW